MSHRRRGNGKDNRGAPSRSVQVSKKLSWLLRHGAKSEGLAMTEDGYVNVQEILNNRNLRSLKVTFEEIEEIVRDNDKQRFALIPVVQIEQAGGIDDRNSEDNGASTSAVLQITQNSIQSQDAQDWLIRARQGHSIKLEDAASLLTPISPGNLPAQTIHGTSYTAWSLILKSGGLRPMGRMHVHFATGLPQGFAILTDKNGETAPPVISGMRNTSTILIYLDLAKAIEKGDMQFGFSENGVVLTEGNADGLVPITYFKRVEDRKRQKILVEDGILLD